jgi:flagellum-specific peptidoglycan hydrolase FlgJ
MLTDKQKSALQMIAAAAVACELGTGCPAELSAAQCILESGWLTRCPGNNCFGIKATDDSRVYTITKEFLNGTWKTLNLAFEKYATLADCFKAHARLIQGGRYAPAWKAYQQTHNLGALIAGIAPIYATAPDYAGLVSSIARSLSVTQEIADARKKVAA